MIIDVVVVIVLLFSAAVSFWRGFIREVLTIVGIVGGVVVSYTAAPLLIPQMSIWFGVVEGQEPEKLIGPLTSEMAAVGASYLGIFVVVTFLLSIISHIISEFARNIGLGALDRSLGVLFGLARGILMLGVVYMPFSLYLIPPEQKKEYLEPAKSFVFLEAVAEVLAGYMPGEMEQQLKDTAEKVNTAEGMKEQLEGLKILDSEGHEDNELSGAGSGVEEGSEGQKDQSGYTQEHRNDMDKLIEQTLDSPQQGQKQE